METKDMVQKEKNSLEFRLWKKMILANFYFSSELQVDFGVRRNPHVDMLLGWGFGVKDSSWPWFIASNWTTNGSLA
jgi:hypothetical protein